MRPFPTAVSYGGFLRPFPAAVSYGRFLRRFRAVALGPVLMGMSRPAHILTPAATVRRVVNMTAIAAVEAQIRAARER